MKEQQENQLNETWETPTLDVVDIEQTKNVPTGTIVDSGLQYVS